MRKKAVLRRKIVVVMMPLLILTVIFVGFVTYSTARNGITAIAKEFLGYKVMDIYKYASRQMSLFEEVGGAGVNLDSVYDAVFEYAKGVAATEKARFFILHKDRTLVRGEGLSEEEKRDLLQKLTAKEGGWVEFRLGGRDFVGVGIYFSDWGSFLLLGNDKEEFYKPVSNILWYIGVILVVAVVLAVMVMLGYLRFLLKPVDHLVETIQEITKTRDLSQRVRVEYNDEIGYLAYSFNTMIRELELAYHQIKNYAYQTIQAKNKEEKIRFVFQKYVPTEVINRILSISSESVLVGAKQDVAVLFSDIRDFTHISEQFPPDFLVTVLNQYFSEMDEKIRQYSGIIDKYIGDAIMAIFGAPAQHNDDADRAIRAAFAMLEALELFNRMSEEKYGIVFRIGIGINFGEAIVGNIGSENKVDYTVIGDTVNLASRLEGLTKKYKVPLVVSEFTLQALKEPSRYFFRVLDFVRVKGKEKPVRIYQPLQLTMAEGKKSYYERFHDGLALYQEGRFNEALRIFEECRQNDPHDYLAYLYQERCEYYKANPPLSWDGAETLTEK